MAELWFRKGIDPDSPDEWALAIVLDPDDHGPAARAVSLVSGYASEMDVGWCLLGTDGWAEQSLDGDVLTVDFVVYPALLAGEEIDMAEFPGRSSAVPDAIRLLRVSAVVDPVEYERSEHTVALLHAPPGTTSDELAAMIAAGEAEPLGLCGPPGPEPWWENPPEDHARNRP